MNISIVSISPSESFETATPAAIPFGRNGDHLPLADESDMEPVPAPLPVVRAALPRFSPHLEPRITPSAFRQLPHSLEAEEHILSLCLIEEEDMLTKCVESKICADSFYDPKHSLVFATLLAMRAASIPLSAATLAQELSRARRLDEVGGYAFITQISSTAPTSAQAAYFIQTVREQATLREIIRAATSAVEDCYTYSGGLAELTADLTRRLTFAVEGRATKDDWPSAIAASAACAKPPPFPDELIAGILYAPGTMLLSGPSKSRKTFTSLDLAIAIASGNKWLGRQCKASPVLYINLELQDFAIIDRIARICEARGIQPPENLHVWNLRGKSVSLQELEARLPGMIAKTGAKCVAIDPHYKISSVSGMEESSNDDQGLLLSKMECLCHNAHAALILTHHFAKGDASAKNAQDRASGAGTFTRWPDVFVTFTPHKEDDAMTIDFFLRNFAPVQSFVVRWEYPRWQTDASLDPKELQSNKPGAFTEQVNATSLLDSLTDAPMSCVEWEKATGLSHTTFHRKRKELLELHRVKVVSGCYIKC